VPFPRAWHGDRTTRSASRPSTPWSTWEAYGGSRLAGTRGASPSGTPQRWRWMGSGGRSRQETACAGVSPTGTERAPTKQSTEFIIIFSDRHSLGWARGGHKGGRAEASWLEGQCRCAPKTVRGTASPANLPRLHGCLPRRLMISNNYIMILSAQGGRGREWVQQGPCLPTAPTTARSQKTAAAGHGVRSEPQATIPGPTAFTTTYTCSTYTRKHVGARGGLWGPLGPWGPAQPWAMGGG
jgi:hypothetical protein